MVSRSPRRRTIGLFASCGAVLLAGCSAKPQEPVEQTVVRAPGVAAAANDAAPVVATADLAATGKVAFGGNCVSCHAVDAGAPTKVGPNLHGVVGRKAGTLAGFAYSAAMQHSGITWSASELDAYLTDPSVKVPGTMMAIGGIHDAAARKAIIAYLTSISPGQ